jgi:hypothetical protein
MKNLEMIQSIAQYLMMNNKKEILLLLLSGKLNINNYLVDRPNLVLPYLKDNWEQIVDTTNPYWNRDMVTDEDYHFIFRRILPDINTVFISLLQQSFQEFEEERIAQYTNAVGLLLSSINAISSQNDIADQTDIQKLQEAVIQLSISKNEIEKVRLYFATLDLNQSATQLQFRELPMELTDQVIEEQRIMQKSEPEKELLELVVGEKEIASATAVKEIAPDKSNVDPDIGTIHSLDRKIVGGYINTLNSPAFLPESMLREKGFDHGDKLKVSKKTPHGDLFRYEFELVEKAKQPNKERSQYNLCVVEKDNTMHFVEKTHGGSVDSYLRFNEVPYKFIIKDEDVKKFKLGPGDLIDIAFRTNDPTSMKVIWKYKK